MTSVVTIGGGTGSYNVLRGLKTYDLSLTAIVSMMDNGGSSGVLRDEHGVLPPGDIRRAIVALSEETDLMKAIFEYRFPESKGFLSGHNLGNIILTGLMEYAGDPGEGLYLASRLMKVRGKALPITTQSANLHALLGDGSVIVGETNIDVPKHDPNLRITKLYLEPSVMAYGPALDAMAQADHIIIGPGDLYTSILPSLLVDDVPAVIRDSPAQKIYVCNIMTKHGETDGYTATDFLDTLLEYLGGSGIDSIIVNNSFEPRPVLDRYRKEQAYPVTYDVCELQQRGVSVLAADVRYQNGLIRHDPGKLAHALMGLIGPVQPLQPT